MAHYRLTRVAVGALIVLVILGLSRLTTPEVSNFRIVQETGEVTQGYDFVVVGGGQSGLVLGNRLSEDGKSEDQQYSYI